MKILVNNGTEELLETLKTNGYDIKTYGDEENVEKVVEVEKIVEVEKPIPDYLLAIKDAVEKEINGKVEENVESYKVYKTKYESIKSLFVDEKEEDSIGE